MTEASLPRAETPRRFQLDWVPAVLFRPRQAFAVIMSQSRGVWLTPILILTLTTLVRIAVAGSIGQAAAQAGEIALPPDSQWWTPEQQAQFMQAMQSTSGPVFVYVFPAISGLLGVWAGRLLVSGLLHLVLTLLGGRGDTRAAINLGAWAGLPFAVRDLVRTISMLATDQLIRSPGLAGFAPAGESGWSLFLASLLKLVDVYVIWHILLLVIGVRSGNGLSRGKAIGGVLFTILLVLSLQSLIGFFTARLGGMTIIRPFF
jgi:hypothetical protein